MYLTLLIAALLISPNCIRTPSDNDAALKELGVTVRQTLRMGLERFSEMYERKHPGGNGREPIRIYAECRRDDNDRRARHLGAPARKRFAALRAALHEWE